MSLNFILPTCDNLTLTEAQIYGPRESSRQQEFSQKVQLVVDVEDITRWREDMNFIFEWQNNILRTSAASE